MPAFCAKAGRHVEGAWQQDPDAGRRRLAPGHAWDRALDFGGALPARSSPPSRWAFVFRRGVAALRDAALREIEDRRGFSFLPIGFATGAALYFGAAHEPFFQAALALAGLFGFAAVLAAAHPAACYGFILLAAVAGGFGIAGWQVQRIAHPVVGETVYSVAVTGFVEAAEQRPRGSRITLLVTGLDRPLTAPPVRVRVTLASRAPPAVGTHVSLRATLSPPPGPAYPGGFDFGRSAWFEGIGATGFALGRVAASAAPVEPPLALQAAAWLDASRQAIAARIRAAAPGDSAGIAVALVTGLRDAVPEQVEETMRVSGLSHILSISGLHMALVAATVFFLVRAGLALFPTLALGYPIKTWAAVPAMLAATCYLLLSGAEVPTQRSYVMTLLVLLGVAVGRPAFTLRTLAIAALVVLVLTPWAILDPGAQMSFAATLALIASYERLGGRLWAPGETGASPAWRWIAVRYIAALILTSLVAGLATAPYAAFHFQRLAPLSLFANLAAMPIVSFIIMPAGLAGALLMPFGWDAVAWRAMGWGIELMVAVADLVAAIPGADKGLPAMPLASLVLLSLALLGACLLRSWLVVLAPLPALLAIAIAWQTPRPDIFIDAQARTVAVRGADGRLQLMGDRSERLAERFAVEQWMSAEGQRSGAVPGANALPPGAACDEVGCTLRGARGEIVALSRSVASLADDCRHAALLVTTIAPPDDCAAQVILIDPRRPLGAKALFASPEGGWRVADSRPPAATRPWHPAPASRPARHATPNAQ